MTRIMLSSEQADGTGGTAERPSYVFPTQDLKVSIEALIDLLIANGVPVVRGTVSDMFVFPRITLSEKTGAQALAELMSIVPDAVCYIDYSGTGLPSINVVRRGDMTADTYAVGVDNVEIADLFPRLDLEVQGIEVQSVTRRVSDGKTQWAAQTSGTAVAGKKQIVIVSGPEPNAFLPKDRYDSFECQTLSLPGTGKTLAQSLVSGSNHVASSLDGPLKDFVFATDERIATLIRELGPSFSNLLHLSNGGRFCVSQYFSGNLSAYTYFDLDRPNIISKEPSTGLYIVTSKDRVPEWAKEQNGWTVIQGSLTGFCRVTYAGAQGPAWWPEVAKRGSTLIGYAANTGGDQWNAFIEFSIPIQLVNQNLPTLTTVYRQWDYDYIAPPSTLAADLLAAQDWVPWEGRVTTVADEVDGAQILNKKVNVTNTLPACATMGALPKRIVYEIMRGRKTVDLGAPARVDFGTLANKFRKNPKDNIVYL
jgi:hypothetical protein